MRVFSKDFACFALLRDGCGKGAAANGAGMMGGAAGQAGSVGKRARAQGKGAGAHRGKTGGRGWEGRRMPRMGRDGHGGGSGRVGRRGTYTAQTAGAGGAVGGTAARGRRAWAGRGARYYQPHSPGDTKRGRVGHQYLFSPHPQKTMGRVQEGAWRAARPSAGGDSAAKGRGRGV